MFFLILYIVLNLLLVRCDLRSGLLPDRYTCPLLWTGLLWQYLSHTEFLADAVLGAMAGYISFAAIYWGYRLLRGHEGLGYGDVKYLAALGAWHGWSVLPALVFYAALFACCAVAFTLCRCRKLQVIKNPLPFGPFLAAAGFVVGYPTLIRF
ncbi:A24 family peptidase [Kosakonia sp. HypNH10]|uniref:prepilin peptidase n=1 Tax=Kosakonia sp. HypNH10 TaxID=2980101 RepID=UPI00244A6989|nr:A24 family peptidase [Kosakonia sp. HypNH10]MDH2915212.1 A24 family peptidase [Kosakonia sp. HypNH10]